MWVSTVNTKRQTDIGENLRQNLSYLFKGLKKLTGLKSH